MSIAAKPAPQSIKTLAIVSGLIGFVCFLLTPFLPVNQTQSSFDWPQKGLNSVNAPLMSYAPDAIEVSVPMSALEHMPEKEWMVLGTLPADSKDATTRGLFVRYTKTGLDVIIRDTVPLSIPVADLPKSGDLKVSSTPERTELTLGSKKEVLEGDRRPQVTGIYTDLPRDAKVQGINAHVDINSRFTSSPSPLKYVVMWLGLAMTLLALWSLHRLDKLDGRASRRFFPKDWWKLRPLDGIVGATLLAWHFIGANTADDGYLLTMARISRGSGYMANYYRWFGVPESPFGAPYYDLLALMTYVSTSSIWMRLPGLLAGWCVWLLISREVLPRLGAKITGRRVAHWTAALTFLAFWMVYNNGTRPEPVIALGALLTWVCMERAIATSRLLPAAVGVIVATLALGAGPTGLMAVAALLAALSSLIRIIYRRIPLVGGSTWQAVLAMVAPFLASGTAILLAVFGDQTPASVLEAIRVRADKGPALTWYMEWVRYESLLGQTVDGSFARRFAVLMVLVSVALVLASMLRNGRVPGSAQGPSIRLLLAFLGTMFFMMFTPTKWTHHFGVWAGIGAAIAGLAAVALSHMALKSARSRTLLFGGILFVLAFSLAGTNGWWYVSSFGVPWYDKTVQFKAVEASTVMLGISLLVLVIGTIQSFVSDVRTARAESQGTLDELKLERRRKLARFDGIAASPIAVVSALVVMFCFLSLGKGFVSQYPAYSVGLGNLRSATGDYCALANDAMLETNSNDSFLQPADGSDLGASLDVTEHRGFDANNVPESIAVEGVAKESSQGSIGGATSNEDTTEAGGGQATGNTGGVRTERGVNGSKAFLPFGLDFHKIPVLGSYTEGPQFPAEATTTWYNLPKRSDDTPLLIVSAAGKIAHHDINGVKQDGQELIVEYGTRSADGNVTNTGELEPLDIGPTPSWRNLRVPMDRIPETANVVRVVAKDQNLEQNQWLAFVPPRVPKLDSLNNVIGSEQAGLLDWAVALQFPCQRTYDHFAGVAEMANFRISPDHPGKVTLSPVMDYAGGGVLGVTEAVNTSVEIPGYLKNDWQRDWGSISRYYPRTNLRGEAPDVAEIHHEVIQRSGLWTPGPMKTDE
ncbi:arabinosyltransferase domain-containing protein [Corynebacterium epidermidicanis]|uniref:Cell wall arabinan synthesis protein n=1 Tax=Corynebacterium epidermidicanis TaxID=1050174 RepID=A0A0G3GR85_9CORY|nr:arabinosyltransferase domain-containing protein [Corynebacterium epidermidicanis]AKK02088.1 cell wall arabinan synthesis protein [Corynebacterium epidermidicanis]